MRDYRDQLLEFCNKHELTAAKIENMALSRGKKINRGHVHDLLFGKKRSGQLVSDVAGIIGVKLVVFPENYVIKNGVYYAQGKEPKDISVEKPEDIQKYIEECGWDTQRFIDFLLRMLEDGETGDSNKRWAYECIATLRGISVKQGVSKQADKAVNDDKKRDDVGPVPDEVHRVLQELGS